MYVTRTPLKPISWFSRPTFPVVIINAWVWRWVGCERARWSVSGFWAEGVRGARGLGCQEDEGRLYGKREGIRVWEVGSMRRAAGRCLLTLPN